MELGLRALRRKHSLEELEEGILQIYDPKPGPNYPLSNVGTMLTHKILLQTHENVLTYLKSEKKNWGQRTYFYI